VKGPHRSVASYFIIESSQVRRADDPGRSELFPSRLTEKAPARKFRISTIHLHSKRAYPRCSYTAGLYFCDPTAVSKNLDPHVIIESMKAYSEDLRRKIVDAVRRGVPKSETASLFGVSLSSVKRFSRMEREGDSLAPKKPPGRPPKGSDATRRLLLADLAERPAASAPQRRRYLERVTGESMSDSTVRRLVKRLGHSRKKDHPSPPSATSS
jgi:transposase